MVALIIDINFVVILPFSIFISIRLFHIQFMDYIIEDQEIN